MSVAFKRRNSIQMSYGRLSTHNIGPACSKVSGQRCIRSSLARNTQLRCTKVSQHCFWRSSFKERQAAGNRGKRQSVQASAALAGPVSATLSPSQIFATTLGYSVLLGSIFRSVPQIIRIVKNKSAEGLSLASFVSELVAYTIIWAYNFNLGYPFSTYGETVACWIQDIILVVLVLNLRKMVNARLALLSAAFIAFFVMLMTNACGHQALVVLQASTILIISFGGRIPQIVMNHQRGDSGELSLLTSLLNVLGCVARIFTTLVLTKDVLNLVAAVTQLALNGILLQQTVQTARNPARKAASGVEIATS